MKTTTGYIVAMFFLAVAAISIIAINANKRRAYINSSQTHEFIVDLNDSNYADAIERHLEQKTFQRVDRELIDPQRSVYRYRVKCPPKECNNIFGWLFGRRSVDDVYQSRGRRR